MCIWALEEYARKREADLFRNELMYGKSANVGEMHNCHDMTIFMQIQNLVGNCRFHETRISNFLAKFFLMIWKGIKFVHCFIVI